MNINPIYHLKRYRQLEQKNEALSKKNALLEKLVTEQNFAIQRAEKEYKLLYSDWQKVVATNAEYERQAHAHLCHIPKKHGKHRQQRGKR